jgi:hypothetical protein
VIDAILEALKIHGPIGAVFLAVGFIGREHFRVDRQRNRQLLNRIESVEAAQKHDLERVFDRIEEVSSQIQTNQNVLLSALAPRQRD